MSVKKLLLFDLNGTILFRDRGPCRKGYRINESKVRDQKVWMRPYAKKFLDFVFGHFDVGVWSSAMKQNVEPLVKLAFGERALVCMLDRSLCTPHPTPEKPYGTLKELSKVWKLFPGKYDEKNTIILDDSPVKALRNPDNNLVLCEYSPDLMTPAVFDSDRTLLDLIPYLQQLEGAADVRSVVREQPFATRSVLADAAAGDDGVDGLAAGLAAVRFGRHSDSA